MFARNGHCDNANLYYSWQLMKTPSSMYPSCKRKTHDFLWSGGEEGGGRIEDYCCSLITVCRTIVWRIRTTFFLLLLYCSYSPILILSCLLLQFAFVDTESIGNGITELRRDAVIASYYNYTDIIFTHHILLHNSLMSLYLLFCSDVERPSPAHAS